MSHHANTKAPFTPAEVQDVMNSLHNITPKDAGIDWDALQRLLGEVAHLSHKDWHVTGRNSERMADILLSSNEHNTNSDDDGSMISLPLRQMFERILHEGNWDGALEHACTTYQ